MIYSLTDFHPAAADDLFSHRFHRLTQIFAAMRSANAAAITATKLPTNRITTKVMPPNRGAAAE